MINYDIRPAIEADVGEIYAMIRELAVFEKLDDQVVSTAESVQACLFGENRVAEALVVESDGQVIGFAIYFHNFSTFVGRPGLYLEDIYIRPAYRREGIGRSLLAELAKIASQRNCGRFEWAVLDWNADAIAFYEQLGATVLPDWRIVRLDAEGIQGLASVRD